MNTKKTTRIIVDVVMLLLFVFEMSQREGRNLFLHAIMGIVLFALFLFHNILNFSFYKVLFKGKYVWKRIVLTAIDILLCVFMIMLIFSSLMISGMALSFMPFLEFKWILLHKFCSGWVFLIMIFHLGLHTNTVLNKIEKQGNAFVRKVIIFAEVLVAAAGIFFFIKSKVWSYIILLDRYTHMPEISIFFMEYFMLILAGCILVHALLSAIKRNTSIHES